MKNRRLIFLSRVGLGAVLLLGNPGKLPAQRSDGPARLAIISETSAAVAAVDLLTVELSHVPQIQLFERTQIEKVYREQGLSAANKNLLTLGQVLGADGLLLLTPVTEGTNQFMQVRLVAVKPGVVVDAVRSDWPVEDVSVWTRWLAGHFAVIFPKLSVPAEEAIPISVVNLRSTIRSTEAQETERQLTFLAAEHLTRERDLFVLERRRMDLLSDEKEKQAMGESAFWKGSYLLEGVIDRDGYSKEIATLHARLVPPNGGRPTELFVSGPRRKPGEMAEALTGKVMEALKRSAGSVAWQPDAEAAKFYEEAKWALKWGMIPEAQAAAEASWALGKQDMDAAIVRIKAQAGAALPDTGGYFGGGLTDVQGRSEKFVEYQKRVRAASPNGVVFQLKGRQINYVTVGKLPDPRRIEPAFRALALYEQFSQGLTAEEIMPNSAWYGLGIESLEAASKVLQHFHFARKPEQTVPAELGELRAMARTVAAWLSQAPLVRDSYWVGDRIVTHDVLAHSIREGQNIFRCQLNYGCFWQERPEDCVGLYRELMTSPVFAYLHHELWFRPLERPRLVAWNSPDAARIPRVWQDFREELGRTTNVITRIEGKFLELADAGTIAELEEQFNATFSTIISNRAVIVGCNVELLYLRWGADDLVQQVTSVVAADSGYNNLRNRYRQEYQPQLEAMAREYWATLSGRKTAQKTSDTFRQQMEYLRGQTPYRSLEFNAVFRSRQYNKAQAEEIRPLLRSYLSNLTAQSTTSPNPARGQLQAGISRVRLLEREVDRVLNPRAPVVPTPPTTVADSARGPVATTPSPAPPAVIKPLTNLLSVTRFHPFPFRQLALHPDGNDYRELAVGMPRLRDEFILFDLHFEYDTGHMRPGQYYMTSHHIGASLLWNTCSNAWQLIPQPVEEGMTPTAEKNRFIQHKLVNTELVRDTLYSSYPGELRKFDLRARRWETLPMPGEKQYRLFRSEAHLLAANDEGILSLGDDGRTVKILASIRRRPAASLLDSLDSLGKPVVFRGPSGTFRARLGDKVYRWEGEVWREEFSLPRISAVESLPDFAVIRSGDRNQQGDIWLLGTAKSARPELCWREEASRQQVDRFGPAAPPPRSPASSPTVPVWKRASGVSLIASAVTTMGENLLCLVASNSIAVETTLRATKAQTGRHADLVLLERGRPAPVVIPLEFSRPPTGLPSGWRASRLLPWENALWILVNDKSVFLGRLDVYGFWEIPRSEFDVAVQHATLKGAQDGHGRGTN